MFFKKAASYLKFIRISFKKYPWGKESLNFLLLQKKKKTNQKQEPMGLET